MVSITAVVSSIAVAQTSIPTSAAQKSIYYGRWTVSEDKPTFSARGIVYKTIDIAPCGTDFCGVSVNKNGTCGPSLFRFFGRRAKGTQALQGHAKWGSQKKNILLNTYENNPEDGGNILQIYIGEGYDFGERSSSMPKYEAPYKSTGAATCRAR